MATATRSGFRLLLKHGNPRGLPAAFVDRMSGHWPFADNPDAVAQAMIPFLRSQMSAAI